MKKFAFAAAGAVSFALAAAAPHISVAQDKPNGEALYNARCKMCHESGSGPDRVALAAFAQDKIVHALTDGAMAAMADGLSNDEKLAIAAYLVNKPGGTTVGGVPAAAGAAGAAGAPAPAGAAAGGEHTGH